MLFSSLSTAFVTQRMVIDKDRQLVGPIPHPAHKAAMALDVAIGVALIALAILNPFGLSHAGQSLLLGIGIAYTASTLFYISSALKTHFLKERGWINDPSLVSLETGEVLNNDILRAFLPEQKPLDITTRPAPASTNGHTAAHAHTHRHEHGHTAGHSIDRH